MLNRRLRCSRCVGALGTSGPLCGDCLRLIGEEYIAGHQVLTAETRKEIDAMIESAVRAAVERCARLVEDSRHGHWDDPPAECIAIATKIREGK